jgi:hypothetical protein
MATPKNPFFEYWSNALQLGMVMAEAQAVIAMRVMGMSGIWSVTPYENHRMVSEKVYAMTKAATDASGASLRGASPAAVMAASIKPVRRKTRANSRRLAKRGPKGL